jgi:Putative quorum-sensing-regulated virulence factor
MKSLNPPLNFFNNVVWWPETRSPQRDKRRGDQRKGEKTVASESLPNNFGLSQPSSCPHCRSTDLYTQERLPQLGLYCRSCSRWIKWVAQNRPIDVMPFGKHRGHLIVDLPIDYIDWILQNVELKGSLYRALEAEFERRGVVA